MSFGRLEKVTGAQPMSEINVTPLVDVMLVLLVIFIITAPLMASRLQLELPKTQTNATPISAQAKDTVSVSLDRSGQWFWDDQPTDDATMQRHLTDAARQSAETEVLIRADATAPYGRVAQLIGLAQQAGLVRVGFVTDTSNAASMQSQVPEPAGR